MSAEDSDNFDEDMDLATGYDDAIGDEPLFWSMTIEPNKETEITEPAIPSYIIHITNACFGVSVNKNSRTIVMINDTPICTLIEGKHENQQLDLLFNEAASITVKGTKPSNVYLTGYIQPAIDGEMDENMLDPMAEDMTEAEIEEALRRQSEQQKMYDDDMDDNKQENEVEPELMDENEIDEPPNKKQKTSKGSKSTKNGMSEDKKPKRKSPQQKPVENKSEKEEKKKKKNKKMQNMKGGIKYRDMKVGSGEVVTNGSKVNVYYVGQTDDKQVFDKSISGNGFDFTFGAGDVIKGWDIGLKGMRVGGKRKLVIPPKLAYGANGSPPSIPGDATLTFTIELKSVN